MLRDYYALLGIARNASPQEIKTAYRTLAAEHHPDKVSGADPETQARAAAVILDLNEAMAVLRDDKRKMKYDYDLSFIPPGGVHAPPASEDAPEAAPAPEPRRESPPPENVAPALRSASLLMRLRALPLPFIELKWPGWNWAMKTEGKNPLVIAYRHVEALNPQVLRAVENSMDAGGARPIVLLTCRRIEDRKKVLEIVDELTTKTSGGGWFSKAKPPMLVLYDDLSNRGVRFGKAPDHDYAAQILKILTTP